MVNRININNGTILVLTSGKTKSIVSISDNKQNGGNMFKKIWYFLFVVKCAKFVVNATGFEHEFLVTTADGKEYKTTRRDYLEHSEYNNVVYMETHSAQRMLSYGIDHGFAVDAPDGSMTDVRVQPIAVSELTVKGLNLKLNIHRYYLWFKPEAPFIKKEVLHGRIVSTEYDYEPKTEAELKEME